MATSTSTFPSCISFKLVGSKLLHSAGALTHQIIKRAEQEKSSADVLEKQSSLSSVDLNQTFFHVLFILISTAKPNLLLSTKLFTQLRIPQ